MSSHSSPPLLSDVVSGQKRNRKGCDPQRLVSAPSSATNSPLQNNATMASMFGEGGFNPLQMQAALAALGQVNAAAAAPPPPPPPPTDPTVAILNLASTLAINMLTMNQQAQQFPQLGSNLILANAAKMMLGLNNLVNPAPAAVPPQQRINADLLASLTASQQPQPQPEPNANMANAFLVQQYLQQMTAARQQATAPPPPQPAPAVNGLMEGRRHMSLKRTIHEADATRKFSAPHQTMFGGGPEKKRNYHQSSPPFQKASEKHVPVSKVDMERCLHRILREEIYNIFDDDVKVEKEDDVPEKTEEEIKVEIESEGKKEVENRNPKTLADLMGGNVPSGDSAFSTVGSAFRKVSKLSPVMECQPPLEVTDSWALTISPEGSPNLDSGSLSPVPIPVSMLDAVRDMAIRHRDSELSALSPLSPKSPSAIEVADPIERFPVIWQGQLAMKNQEATVQFHMVAGVGDLVLKSLGNTKEGPTQHVKRVVRINQRMRLEPSQLQTVMGKLNGQSPFACMICLPCGENREVFQCNAQTFKTAFVDYFTQKQAAGIANIPERELTQSCLVHIFPPGPFPAQYLEYFSPELFQNIKQKDASYLFIVLTPEERVAA